MFEKNAEAPLNPHFLFNSMNAIRYMIFENQDLASELLGKLAELIRYQLNDGVTNTSFSDDLTQLEHLLELEALRLEERFTLTKHLSKLVSPHPLPCSVLLPLVEYVFIKKDIYSVSHNELIITTKEVGSAVVFTLNLTQSPKIKSGDLPLDNLITQLGMGNICSATQTCDANTYTMELTFNNEY
jgi:LytS/YehU family sensor histidine kinase